MLSKYQHKQLKTSSHDPVKIKNFNLIHSLTHLHIYHCTQYKLYLSIDKSLI